MRVIALFPIISLVLPFLTMGCEDPELDHNHPPVVRLSMEPQYVPKGTPTQVHLDASRSCDELDHPEGCAQEGGVPRVSCPGGVSFSWEMGGSFKVLSTSAGGSVVDVQLTATRPVEVVLTVTDCEGNASVVRRWIGISDSY